MKLLFVLFFLAQAAPKKIKYQTAFGECPSRSAGSLVLELIKIFETRHSLRSLKTHLGKGDLLKRHFIGDYRIVFDPLRNFLKFTFRCPAPLMKVQIYKGRGHDSYEAILVENGRLVDPTYEILLKSEKKLRQELPYLAIPVGKVNNEIQAQVAGMVGRTPFLFRQKLSEIILNREGELTVILGFLGKPVAAFLGKRRWAEKIKKLQRIVSFVEGRKEIPSAINLTNLEKVVVKFNGKF